MRVRTYVSSGPYYVRAQGSAFTRTLAAAPGSALRQYGTTALLPRPSQSVARGREREGEGEEATVVQCSAVQCKQAVQTGSGGRVQAGRLAGLAGRLEHDADQTAGGGARQVWLARSESPECCGRIHARGRTNERTNEGSKERKERKERRTNERRNGKRTKGMNERKERTKEGTDEGRNGRQETAD